MTAPAETYMLFVLLPWLAVLTDLRNPGAADVFFVVSDGLKGLPDSVNAAFPQALVQTWRPRRWRPRPGSSSAGATNGSVSGSMASPCPKPGGYSTRR